MLSAPPNADSVRLALIRALTVAKTMVIDAPRRITLTSTHGKVGVCAGSGMGIPVLKLIRGVS